MLETLHAAVRKDGATSADAPFLRLLGVSKSFGRNVVLDSIDLDVPGGEFLTILGESGSGKTTLLRIIAGFEEASSGQILLQGAALEHLPPFRRPINTVFQSYALFPHMTVFENVAYGLRVRRCPKLEVSERVHEALRLVRMEQYNASSPSQISGGQRQRIALARALINKPRLLLLDEPLSALDANLRTEMQKELKLLQQQLGITFLFVTHDQEEAMAMSDRIVLLNRGRIEQCASPREIYLLPRTPYVASFIGKSNVVTGVVAAGVAECGPFRLPVDAPDGPILFSLRPECIRIAETGAAAGELPFEAAIEVQQFHGASVAVSLRCADGTALTARLPALASQFAGSATRFACRVEDFVRLAQS